MSSETSRSMKEFLKKENLEHHKEGTDALKQFADHSQDVKDVADSMKEFISSMGVVSPALSVIAGKINSETIAARTKLMMALVDTLSSPSGKQFQKSLGDLLSAMFDMIDVCLGMKGTVDTLHFLLGKMTRDLKLVNALILMLTGKIHDTYAPNAAFIPPPIDAPDYTPTSQNYITGHGGSQADHPGQNLPIPHKPGFFDNKED